MERKYALRSVETGRPLADTIQRKPDGAVASRDTVVEDLAIDLLTSGGADMVLSSPNWPRHRRYAGPHEQLEPASNAGVYDGKPVQTASLLPSGGARPCCAPATGQADASAGVSRVSAR